MFKVVYNNETVIDIYNVTVSNTGEIRGLTWYDGEWQIVDMDKCIPADKFTDEVLGELNKTHMKFSDKSYKRNSPLDDYYNTNDDEEEDDFDEDTDYSGPIYGR